VEVERLSARSDLDVRFAPYLLDPSTPPEGKPRRQMTQPGDPPTHMELRAESLGIRFSRGRTWTSNSHLGLEAAEFVTEEHPELAHGFHKRMFKAYFDELADIGEVEALVRFGNEAGVPADALRASLEEGRYRQQVDDGIAWAREVGVTAVPTFVINERYAVVGAQPMEVFEETFKRLEISPRDDAPHNGATV
jgi:predicted DsbA family dithiol-disulfide isomerase